MKAFDKKALTETIKNKALEIGFYDCGISMAGYLDEDAIHLKNWLEKGYHSQMSYMSNHFEKRTDPGKLLENAQSVISVLLNYDPKQSLPENNNYKISSYAYGKDYHFVIKKKLKQLITFIQKVAGDMNARAFVDSAPVLDRAWAARSGLGWIGKNTMLITKERGSFFFIGEIITDLELEYDNRTVANYCGGCRRCIETCPTGALKPHELDASKCISNMTIEFKGDDIPVEFNGKFDDWIFGCDICQQVCPWNRFAEPHNELEFEPSEALLKMKRPDWENLTEIKFAELFKSSPLKRAGFKGIKRNVNFVKRKEKINDSANFLIQ
jgi:epoxyqueuosine reductase